MPPQETIEWGNVLTTLLIRFVAVFVVLGTLQVCMYVTGAIVSRLVAGPAKPPSNP